MREVREPPAMEWLFFFDFSLDRFPNQQALQVKNQQQQLSWLLWNCLVISVDTGCRHSEQWLSYKKKAKGSKMAC